MTRRFSNLACITVVLAACVLPVCAGDILDRVVATVNGHVILQSDWEDAVRSEAFIAGRKLDQVTADDEKAALDRLIPSESHVTLAWGRDYSDVSPVRGVILGGGHHTVSVAVDLEAG